MFSDLELSKRLEKAEADGARAFVEARMSVSPRSSASWTTIGGATVLFDGADSPVTQTFGLGLFEDATGEVLDEIESYFAERGAPVNHEVSPLAGVETYALLQRRGYAPSELTSVMFAPIDAVQRCTNEAVQVRVVRPEEFDVWARLGAEAWASEMPELFDFIAEMGAVSAHRTNAVSMFAEIGGEPVAAAAMSISGNTAHMAGAATIPKARGRGAQNALLAARLAYARERGCATSPSWAQRVVAHPSAMRSATGSASPTHARNGPAASGNFFRQSASIFPMTRRTCLLSAATAALSAQWPQWGGPNRNFQIDNSPPLKSKWPATGPKVLWKRPLGDGYSGPSVDANVIYTMCGRLSEETTMAIDAKTGKTIWEQTGRSAFRSEAPNQGHGPYATPLVANGRVFTASVTGRIDCRAAKDGALLWQHELKGTRLPYGYAASPIAFRDTIIVPCGGKGRSLVALRQSDGKEAWAANDFPNVYSSPVMINVEGLEQLVMLMDGFVFGVNAHNGDIQWRVPFQASYSIAVATPLWAPGNLLFISSEYDAGAKVIKLTRSGMQTKAEEVWSVNRLRLHHGNTICVDGTLYFSSGGKGSVAILSAVDIATGKIHWQDRTIGKATFVCADKKLITLDQDGNLMLIEPSPEKLKILAKAELLTNLSWTPPVLAGSRLFIRDRKSLMALELG